MRLYTIHSDHHAEEHEMAIKFAQYLLERCLQEEGVPTHGFIPIVNGLVCALAYITPDRVSDGLIKALQGLKQQIDTTLELTSKAEV